MKNKIIKIIILVFMILCLVGTVYYFYKIVSYKRDLTENFNIHEQIKKFVITVDEPNEEKNETKYKIDFESLKKQNSDTVAYLKVNNTNIDHIVVKAEDNSYYLRHNFNKKWSGAGWVFADYHNKFDGSDKNIVIYGHSMLNGSMFGTLRNVLKPEWYENPDNQLITLVTEKGNYTYQVFSVYVIKAEDYYINTIFKNKTEFNKFVNKIKSRSKYNFNVKVDGNDKILTLSSCYDNNDRRVVLHAKLIK